MSRDKQGIPLKVWQWYGAHQGRSCPVAGHGPLSGHTDAEIIECAINSGIIDWPDLLEEKA